MVDTTLSVLALLTGLVTGAVFAALEVPIPAPPELPGVLGIVGIYAGYRLVQWADVGVNLLDAVGL
ncbi:XapX domain-containing protein [Halobaculum sp. MBLA0147]|uniref:XapX domain-containing protein n=1 Tax=Halobaculum sp. MBLA0147 TaxID=3079934 RepID=UPI003525037C